MHFADGGLYFNRTHALVAFVLMALLDCVLTAYALRSTTGLREVNPVMRFFMQRLGIVGGLLFTHYAPLGVALLLAHYGNMNGWGYIVDGIFLFGAVDVWDAWQLHRAGRL